MYTALVISKLKLPSMINDRQNQISPDQSEQMSSHLGLFLFHISLRDVIYSNYEH